MKFSADDFKRLYAGMPDEELRSLVRAELTEVARQCYDAELARRGLSATPPRRTIQPVVVAQEPEEIAPESEGPLEEAVEKEEEEDLATMLVWSKTKSPAVADDSRGAGKTSPVAAADAGTAKPAVAMTTPSQSTVERFFTPAPFPIAICMARLTREPPCSSHIFCRVPAAFQWRA
jgi:hypothetical protein